MRKHVGGRRGKRNGLDDGVGEPSSRTYLSVRELFWDSLPTYMAIGMSADEFWHGDPKLAVAYRKAERIRQENRYLSEWRAGIYVGKAVDAVLSKKAEYPPEPLFSTMRDDAVRNEREKTRMESMMQRFGARVTAVNKRIVADAGPGGQAPPS